jgi:ferrous iron transport protein A
MNADTVGKSGEMTLTQMKIGQKARVTRILGEGNCAARLESLGIRPGMMIQKCGAHFWKGPVTVTVGKSKMAVGHGMAGRILVSEVS